MLKQFLTQPTRRQCEAAAITAFASAALVTQVFGSPIPTLLLCVIGVLALLAREGAR